MNSPLSLGAVLSFCSAECVSVAAAEIPQMLLAQSRAEQSFPVSGPELSHLAGEGPPCMRAISQPLCSAAMLYHNGTVCVTPPLPHPKLGIDVGIELVPITIG